MLQVLSHCFHLALGEERLVGGGGRNPPVLDVELYHTVIAEQEILLLAYLLLLLLLDCGIQCVVNSACCFVSFL